jgi:hypothetical protein
MIAGRHRIPLRVTTDDVMALRRCAGHALVLRRWKPYGEP